MIPTDVTHQIYVGLSALVGLAVFLLIVRAHLQAEARADAIARKNYYKETYR